MQENTELTKTSMGDRVARDHKV